MTAALKRIWKNVTVEPGEEEGTWGPLLDGSPVRLPSRKRLQVRSRPLAEALAEEWGGVPMGKEVRPDDLPLTRISGNMIDRIGPEPEATRARLLPFGRDDTVCYRNEGQDRALLDRVLGWAEKNGLHPAATEGLMPLEQPEAYMQALAARLAPMGAEELAALGVMAPAMGSLLLPLAVMDGALTVEEAARLASAEELHQMQVNGHDEDLAAQLARREEDVREAKRFLDLARSARPG
ncbi:ATP12 chaperone protein [Oecophyllibacter saccharovorans]|uniref:ATP12 family protein n=1 Tax=Oecophyllibacter saccharovorans TaxID=2558360 RepID=UPI0011428085|nr:ATP12 family protein [Oecophyllibacter saccharovorans]QDH15495.1 ATP12 chaperone protein [Oecophyllibacter saccharovorans]